MSKSCPYCSSTAPLHTVRFESPLWIWKGDAPAAWYFVTVPEALGAEIKFFSQAGIVHKRPGFGSVRVHAQIGDTTWDTSLFPASKFKSYLLPVKASVRKACKLSEGTIASVSVHFHQP